jgi:serine/threonine protein kinase
MILLALKVLHDNDIIHANLKPSNIMLERDGTIKICDVNIF